jgi:hypothetical protein
MLWVRCWGPRQWAPLTNALLTSPASAALNYPRYIIMNGDRASSQIPGARASTPQCQLLPPTSFLQKPLHIAMEDKSRHLPGAHHQCLLQLRWWLLPELPTTPPKGGAIDVSSTSVVATTGATGSTSQGRGPTIDAFLNFGGCCCQSYR